MYIKQQVYVKVYLRYCANKITIECNTME